MEQRIKKILDDKRAAGLFRKLTAMHPTGDYRIIADGKEYINLSSNDYLGLASDKRLAEASFKALSPVMGSSSSRLMTGTTSYHEELEERICVFKRKPAAMVFNSGYQANVGIISALLGRNDCVFSDKLNHASIIDGIKLSGAKMFRFKHNDAEHLEALLKAERHKYGTALVVTETVFSMDGDISPLEKMTSLKDHYDLVLMVDEAHATGIFGERGSGVTEAKGAEEKVDIIMGTFSKALGGFGAYAAMSVGMRDYLINTCRSFIYSTSLPPSVIAANTEALDIVEAEPHRRQELLKNSEYLRIKLKDRGFTVRGESQIVPVMIGGNPKTVKMSAFLKEKGFWVTPVRPPTVPRGEARLRLSLTFHHTKDMLDDLVKVMSEFKG
ncbi:MAG: 8-amino-7-oxononanoate synthase [Candidatus Omnitrophica bacterium]|nr:8-amino-7-oxononanoate synthase [Candidatus Omnitrophota bacterium]